MRIVIKDKKGYLYSDSFQALRKTAIGFPGWKKFLDDAVMFEPTGANLEYLEQCENMEWSEGASEMLNRVKMLREAAAKTIDMKSMPIESFNFPFKTEPFEHQKRAFFISKDKKNFGYFMEMGTGKSKVLIDNIAYLYSKGEIDAAVIVAPNGVHRQWVEEQLPAHMPEWVEYDSMFYKAGDKKIVQRISEMVDKKGILRIFTFNCDCFSRKEGTNLIKTVLHKTKAMLALDESTRFKTPGSLRTKNALSAAPMAWYRRILSGAPVTKGIEDLYSQMKFLDPDILGFNSFYTFRNKYCILGGWEGRQIVGYKNVEELQKRIAGHSFRVTKSECLDLPEKIYTTRTVELSKEQKICYDQLKEDYFTMVDGKVVDATMAITRLMRMQQVICGMLPIISEDTLETTGYKDLESNRLKLCIELVQEAEGKIIIWSRFVRNINQIELELKKLGIDCVTYYGDVSNQKRAENIKRFKEHPDCKVFIAQPASGGTGLNLAVANTVIYYSNDFNADTRWQSEDRAHRIGQKSNVTYIDIIAEKTIDRKIMKALRDKKSVADLVIDSPLQIVEDE